jgi:hypothetical protein
LVATGSIGAVVAYRLQPTTVSASYDAQEVCHHFFSPTSDIYGDNDRADMESAVELADEAARQDRRYERLSADVRAVSSVLPTSESAVQVQRAKRDCRALGYD